VVFELLPTVHEWLECLTKNKSVTSRYWATIADVKRTLGAAGLLCCSSKR